MVFSTFLWCTILLILFLFNVKNYTLTFLFTFFWQTMLWIFFKYNTIYIFFKNVGHTIQLLQKSNVITCLSVSWLISLKNLLKDLQAHSSKGADGLWLQQRIYCISSHIDMAQDWQFNGKENNQLQDLS